MWTCDVRLAMAAIEEECGICCVESIENPPYCGFLRIKLTSGDRYDFFYNAPNPAERLVKLPD